MSYSVVGNCPRCGAPLYSPALWGGVTPPPVQYSCTCRFGSVPYAPQINPWWPYSPVKTKPYWEMLPKNMSDTSGDKE